MLQRAPFAHYWMHNGYINVDNRKMSKSLGNFFTVRDVAEEYGYEPIRYLMVASHYRSPINYSVEVIEQCKAALERLYTCRENLAFVLESAKPGEKPDDAAARERFRSLPRPFCCRHGGRPQHGRRHLALFDLARDINTTVSAAKRAFKGAGRIRAFLFDELCACWACFTTGRLRRSTKRLKPSSPSAPRRAKQGLGHGGQNPRRAQSAQDRPGGHAPGRQVARGGIGTQTLKVNSPLLPALESRQQKAAFFYPV